MNTAASQRRFHQKTAALTAQFFRTAKHVPTHATLSCFSDIVTHLNPLAQLPPLQELRLALKTRVDCPPCIICEVTYQNVTFLSDESAAMYLTTCVLTNTKSIEQAKRDMMQDKLWMCVSHKRTVIDQMLNSLRMGAEVSKTGEISNQRLFHANLVYNKLINCRRLYNDQEVIIVTSEDFREVLENWLLVSRPVRAIRKRKGSSGEYYQEDGSASEKEFGEERPEYEPENNTRNPPIEEPNEEQVENTVVNEPAGVLEKQVKQEEPDYPATPETVPEPAAPPRLEKPVIYTLPDGKKVMKATFATSILARRGLGNLVTYRFKKRVVDPAAAEGDAKDDAPAKDPLIRRVDYKPRDRTAEQIEERKPEFLDFGGEPKNGVSTESTTLS